MNNTNLQLAASVALNTRIGSAMSAVTVQGPKLTLATRSTCCIAARRRRHSLQQQSLTCPELTLRGTMPTLGLCASLTQHPFACAAGRTLQRGACRQSGHLCWSISIEPRAHFRGRLIRQLRHADKSEVAITRIETEQVRRGILVVAASFTRAVVQL